MLSSYINIRLRCPLDLTSSVKVVPPATSIFVGIRIDTTPGASGLV